jgi:hypothetical protein
VLPFTVFQFFTWVYGFVEPNRCKRDELINTLSDNPGWLSKNNALG